MTDTQEQDPPQSNLPSIIGSNMYFLIAVVLILAGFLKLLNMGAEDMVQGLEKSHLIQHRTLISVTAIACGTLMLVPYTRPIGFLMATAYWGGAIVAHMTYDDSFFMPAMFLGVMWLSGWFRKITYGKL